MSREGASTQNRLGASWPARPLSPRALGGFHTNGHPSNQHISGNCLYMAWAVHGFLSNDVGTITNGHDCSEHRRNLCLASLVLHHRLALTYTDRTT